MKYLFIVLFTGFCVLAAGQSVSVITDLDASLKETSGLIQLQGRIITHNDSGDKAALYELNASTGKIARTVIVKNAVNVDWEAIAQNDTHIFVGDIGNNAGRRKDLVVYKISISDYVTASNDSVTAEQIFISYEDQTVFNTANYETNFDAEALVFKGNELYLFSKNWGNNQCRVYKVPTIAGTYKLPVVTSFNAKGLITGATYNEDIEQIVLTGYSFVVPFVCNIPAPLDAPLKIDTFYRKVLNMPTGYSSQVEAISAVDEDTYYITAEEYLGRKAGLFKLTCTTVSNAEVSKGLTTKLYPNPAHAFVKLRMEDFKVAHVYNSQGQHVFATTQTQIDLSNLGKGIYQVQLVNGSGDAVVKRLFVQ